MIRAGLSALALLAALGAYPAQAQDARLVERLYDPDAVVTITGKTKVQAAIEFGDHAYRAEDYTIDLMLDER